MAVAVVVFNGTRLNDSDANTGWGNYVVGGGAPASEFPLAYQVTSGTTSGAVNKKITSTSARQGVDFLDTGTVDFTAAANRLFFCKIYVSDSFDLNTTWGVEVSIGSDDTNQYHQYNVAGSGANLSVYSQYPPQGGYLITAIDPTIDTWAESADVGGTFDQTLTAWYAVGAQFVNGTAKAENVAFDSIDYGTGLTITAGDGASTEGNFIDFVTEDQDDKTNRWGVVTGSGNVVRAHGVLTIGTTAVTEFLDDTSIVLFPDGYHSRGLVGIAIGNSHASSIINIGALLIGEGTRNGVDANDTRPDYTVTGTSNIHNFYGTMRNFRDVTFQSACSVDGADIECMLLVQNSADIENSTIRTNALTSVACLQDPTFGTTTDLHDCEFVQVGAGHAIEIDTVGSYTLTNLTFTGYGADTTDDAALDLTAGSGTYNITISGGTTPTYKTAGATVNIIAGAVSLTITVRDIETQALIEGANVLIKAGATGPMPSDVTLTSLTQSAGTATATHPAVHNLETGDKVLIEDASPEGYNGVHTITVTSTTVYTFPVDSGLSSPATGTIKATGVIISDLTNASGVVTKSRAYASNQSFTGTAKQGSFLPVYKSQPITGTIDKDNGLSSTVLMIPD